MLVPAPRFPLLRRLAPALVVGLLVPATPLLAQSATRTLMQQVGEGLQESDPAAFGRYFPPARSVFGSTQIPGMKQLGLDPQRLPTSGRQVYGESFARLPAEAQRDHRLPGVFDFGDGTTRVADMSTMYRENFQDPMRQRLPAMRAHLGQYDQAAGNRLTDEFEDVFLDTSPEASERSFRAGMRFIKRSQTLPANVAGGMNTLGGYPASGGARDAKSLEGMGAGLRTAWERDRQAMNETYFGGRDVLQTEPQYRNPVSRSYGIYDLPGIPNGSPVDPTRIADASRDHIEGRVDAYTQRLDGFFEQHPDARQGYQDLFDFQGKTPISPQTLMGGTGYGGVFGQEAGAGNQAVPGADSPGGPTD